MLAEPRRRQIAPADSLVTALTDEALEDHYMKYVLPDLRERVRGGQRIMIAGKALLVGSSREVAVPVRERSVYPHLSAVSLY
jgi:3-isopropylmalate dehydratase small subunit